MEKTQHFQLLLRKFNKIISNDPKPESVKADLLSLREIATEKINDMNARQIEAIVARVNNYLSGNYGNTKSSSNLLKK